MNMEHTCADRFDPDEINRRLLSFLDRSPVSFYAVRNMAEELENAGGIQKNLYYQEYLAVHIILAMLLFQFRGTECSGGFRP